MYIHPLNTRSPLLQRCNISTLASALVLVTSSTLALSQAQAAQSFKPEASAAFVQALTGQELRGQNNALISVTYDLKQWHINGEKPPSYQKLFIGKQTVTLRDDGRDGDKKSGDGIFSSFVEFDFKALFSKHRRIEKWANATGKKALPPHFENRQLLGRAEIISSNSLFPIDPTIQPVIIGPVKQPIITLTKEGSLSRLDNRSPDTLSQQKENVRITPIMSEEMLPAAIRLGKPIPLQSIGIPSAISEQKSLLIRDPAVVTDPSRTFDVCTGAGNPNGVWTFKHLVTEMANEAKTGITPEKFVRMWLSQWETSQNVNGWNIADRKNSIRNRVIDPWEAASGGPEEPLDLNKAPFQLLAVVNRVDLRENLVYGGGSAGEGRFVFQVMDGCNPMRFTVIFEYGIEKRSCSAVQNWGQRWVNLGNMVLGSAAYNAALENITESFVRANAAPSKPNGSALNQLRTNEIALARPWELREFVIADAGWNQHLLKPNTVALTPDDSLNNTPILRNYFASGISGVPLRFPTVADPFLGGASTAPRFFWNAPNFPMTLTQAEQRQEFSLNTCNGCHTRETGTSFTHIKPGAIPATLSGFMTGITVTDPAPPPGITITRRFNDLERRSADLDGLVNSSCFAQMARPVLRAPH